ncbi:High temperature lethal protein 1 [Nakaseomyces bracarensis]|uniref:High temperature lethal protein 1 n=1 Tax=Nakaseomyces bracarensis TaxID=273131 RepID=A0ABR4NYM4_9SACH
MEVTYRKQYNNITLKSLTAYQLMLYRESMLELFGAIDDSDRSNAIISPERQKKNDREIDELLAAFKK